MLATPLNALVAHCAKGGKFYWNNEHEAAFNALVDAVCTAPVLQQPWFKDQFTINCDASTYAISAVLQQGDEKGKLHPIAFLSRTLNATQQNWDIYNKELFAVVHALLTWRPYLIGNPHKTIVNTNHNNLMYFKVARKLNRKQARWMQELAEFDFELQHVPSKRDIPANFLSQPLVLTRGRMTMKKWYYSQLHTLPRSNSLKISKPNTKFFAFIMIIHSQATLESQI